MDAEETVDFIVIGGGASGFFGAINLARAGQKVLLLEKFQKVLSKLAVSGGGRCNVTHRPMDPKQLTGNYPRGQKALLGPFHYFTSAHMIEWLEEAGVDLKIEADGRVFPSSNSSQTIIDCFTSEAIKAGVDLRKGVEVEDIILGTPLSEVRTSLGSFKTKNILVATGSNKAMWDILKTLGHTIMQPTPSLFALNTPSSPFNTLSGVALKEATIGYKNYRFTGPFLFTHFGLSGPAVLKLSSFAAIDFCQADYKAELTVDFCPDISSHELMNQWLHETKPLKSFNMGLPKRLWEKLLELHKIDPLKPLNHISKAQKLQLVQALKETKIPMDGKTTHKEEFVTAGGVDLNEVNFTTMESKLHKGLYFAGEVLNIDGVTGGFNFQAAWTTSYLVSASLKDMPPGQT